LPRALDGLAVARGGFADDYGSLQRGLLSRGCAPVVGRKRLFPWDQREGRGFAVLSGGRTCPSRHFVGGGRRHLRWDEVEASCRRTGPWEGVRGDGAPVSCDEHPRPRGPRKYALGKGYVTTRNQPMRCEKRFYGYHVERERYLCVQATPGPVERRDLAVPLTRRVLRAGRPRHRHALFDAGAGKADADVRALRPWAAAEPNRTGTRRACRYPHRVRAWKPLPSGLLVACAEPGPWVGAPPQEIRLAETATVLKGAGPEEAVRTVVCREVVPGPKEGRWHPLDTSGQAEPAEVRGPFRQRQHHAPAYRIGVPDESLNAAPCGYDPESPDRQRPRFPRGPWQLIGWLLALVYNAVGDLGVQWADRYPRAHVETRRRTFSQRPGKRYRTPEALIGYLDPFRGQEELVPGIDDVNAEPCRIPWLENRRLLLSLTPGPQAQRGGP
jgi:hypothetical protein